MLQDYLTNAVKINPDHIAVKSLERSLTYRQLDEDSSAIASQLRGILPLVGERIGIYTVKSCESIIAIFSILKYGGIYVPLDPEAPAERTAYITKDCGIKVMITDNYKVNEIIRNSQLFPHDLILINISQSASVLRSIPDTWQYLNFQRLAEKGTNTLDLEVRSDCPAYILYTSGSTGKPKGVVLSHQNAMVFVDWSADLLKIQQTDVFSSHAPFHFDLSIFDIFVCIKCAATLVLIPAGISYFADALSDFIFDNKISIWYSVPSALIRLLSEPSGLNKKLKSIKTLIYAGEIFPYKYLNQLLNHLEDCEVYNFYGPTETNVITYYQIETSPKKELISDVPIGINCPYADIKIVDEELKEVSDGEKGELIVSGSSLMSGYWGDKQKSNAVIKDLEYDNFITAYYLTGDIVSKTPEQHLIFFGRKDNMIKTRGFRVELGEVESAFSRHNSIKRVASLAIPDPEIGNRIYVYLQPEENYTFSIDEIHKSIKQTLPVYMIPEKIFVIPSMPLTSTGKIDRQALKERIQSGEL